jgi:hypothetical protein
MLGDLPGGQQLVECGCDLIGARIAGEKVADVRPRHAIRLAGPECGKDGIGDRVAQGVAEDQLDRSFAVLPERQSGAQVRLADLVGPSARA